VGMSRGVSKGTSEGVSCGGSNASCDGHNIGRLNRFNVKLKIEYGMSCQRYPSWRGSVTPLMYVSSTVSFLERICYPPSWSAFSILSSISALLTFPGLPS
jgi:hypothetical protein